MYSCLNHLKKFSIKVFIPGILVCLDSLKITLVGIAWFGSLFETIFNRFPKLSLDFVNRWKVEVICLVKKELLNYFNNNINNDS